MPTPARTRTPRPTPAATIVTPDLSALPRTALLTTAEAAAALGLAAETLANWRVTGRYNLPYVRSGRLPRYRVGDLLDWLERRSQTHTGQTARPTTAAGAP